MPRLSVVLLSCSLLLIIFPLFSSAYGKKLTAEECGLLRQQRQEMVKKGVGDKLEKGAKWASANLNADEIKEVGVFLGVLEKVRFRCAASDIDKKSRFGLLVNIPLPVRNSRRVAKNKPAVASPANDGAMASETKAVLSAVTKGQGEETTKTGAGQAPEMRKSHPE